MTSGTGRSANSSIQQASGIASKITWNGFAAAESELDLDYSTQIAKKPQSDVKLDVLYYSVSDHTVYEEVE